MDLKAAERQGKVMLVIQFDHCIDIITNSSSELFVLENKEGSIMEELVSSVYPDYKTEYEDPISLYDASEYEFAEYMNRDFLSDYWDRDEKDPSDYKLIPGMTFDECYEVSQWQSGRGKLSYDIKSSVIASENREKILSIIDPNKKIYLLFSHNQNPNWDNQEALMSIGTRYHMG